MCWGKSDEFNNRIRDRRHCDYCGKILTETEDATALKLTSPLALQQTHANWAANSSVNPSETSFCWSELPTHQMQVCYITCSPRVKHNVLLFTILVFVTFKSFKVKLCGFKVPICIIFRWVKQMMRRKILSKSKGTNRRRNGGGRGLRGGSHARTSPYETEFCVLPDGTSHFLV